MAISKSFMGTVAGAFLAANIAQAEEQSVPLTVLDEPAATVTAAPRGAPTLESCQADLQDAAIGLQIHLYGATKGDKKPIHRSYGYIIAEDAPGERAYTGCAYSQIEGDAINVIATRDLGDRKSLRSHMRSVSEAVEREQDELRKIRYAQEEVGKSPEEIACMREQRKIDEMGEDNNISSREGRKIQKIAAAMSKMGCPAP